MKRRINIICVLILVVIICECLSSLFFMGYGFNAGLQAGMETGKNSYDITSLESDYSFIPEHQTIIGGSDTLMLSSGQKVGFIPLSGYVLRNQSASGDGYNLSKPSQATRLTMMIGSSVVNLAVLVLIIMALVDFIRFIVAINRNHIFEYRNVRFLNRVGIYMLVVAALLIICGVASELVSAPFIPHIEGYEVARNWSLPVSEILIGLLALLMAQIWRRAIILKEEQALTI